MTDFRRRSGCRTYSLTALSTSSLAPPAEGQEGAPGLQRSGPPARNAITLFDLLVGLPLSAGGISSPLSEYQLGSMELESGRTSDRLPNAAAAALPLVPRPRPLRSEGRRSVASTSNAPRTQSSVPPRWTCRPRPVPDRPRSASCCHLPRLRLKQRPIRVRPGSVANRRDGRRVATQQFDRRGRDPLSDPSSPVDIPILLESRPCTATTNRWLKERERCLT
jgi:hypothetical protein